MEKNIYPSFRVQFGNYNKDEGIVSYNIRILTSQEISFHINDRYRNMRSLWEEIRRDSSDPDRIPDFPPKKWFGKSKEFLEQRKSGLENFFNTLLENPDKVVYQHIMRYFSKLAKNREAKDALTSIEELVASGGKSKKENYAKPQQEDIVVDKPKEEKKQGKPANSKVPYKDQRVVISSKDYSES
jgi:hypothetical protein